MDHTKICERELLRWRKYFLRCIQRSSRGSSFWVPFPLVASVWSVPHTHSRTTTALACIFQCFFCQQVQQSCNSSSASPDASDEPCPSDMVKMTKSKTFQAYLPSCHRTYSCIHCRAHLANHDELISKSFQGSQGRAYLFNSVVNIGCGPAEERVLLTGLHAVADIYCENCKTTLGWKYEHAFESSQKYKEGKFIIELAHMIKDNGWE
ncbi:protein yippee-like 1 isoform X1 [Osmerus eperlanus]|uniref:protein yippee-like 1 isoform X1 n=1 Tax=Osmerus eperlanus TaxID=29151 RepID=UPI002E10808D